MHIRLIIPGIFKQTYCYVGTGFAQKPNIRQIVVRKKKIKIIQQLNLKYSEKLLVLSINP